MVREPFYGGGVGPDGFSPSVGPGLQFCRGDHYKALPVGVNAVRSETEGSGPFFGHAVGLGRGAAIDRYWGR